MKKLLFLFCIISAAVTAQEKKFSLTAQIKGCTDGKKIFLVHKYNDKLIADSAICTKEQIKFKGSTPEPNMYWLTLQKTANPLLVFFIDAGQVTITGHIDSLSKASVKAGKTHTHYMESVAMTNDYNKERAALYNRFQTYQYSGNQAGAQQIFDSAKLAEKNYAQRIIEFIKKNPESNVSGFMIFSSMFEWPSIPTYDSMYNALSEKVKMGKFGKLALEKINSIKGTTIGYPALDFSQASPEGKNISLSSFKGKYVLVDFWASWCGPCRRENPTVVAAYQKYKDKGFDVFGVSLDDNKDKWLAAIKKDNLTWTHVSDLKGWQNAAAKAYGVSSIPFNLLLDKDGKILAKNLRGEQLYAELAKIFGE